LCGAAGVWFLKKKGFARRFFEVRCECREVEFLLLGSEVGGVCVK
jgi:hypothetical protein